MIDDGVLAKFLGDAESPAHTEWLSEYLAKDYSFHQATLKYVVESFNKILALAKENQTAPDPLLMIDLFHETDDDETAPKVKPKKKAGGKPNDPPPPPPPSPTWYRLQQLENGFAVLPGEGSRPESCTIRMAYDTEKGDAFKKYHPADFRLDRRDEIHVDPQGFQITTRAKNRIAADLTQDDFKLVVTGFDPNRDVVVEVRKGTAREDQPEEEDADAEEV